MTYERILVVIDRPGAPSTALDRAAALAARDGAELRIVHAFEGYEAGGILDIAEAAELEQLEYEARVLELEALSDPLRRRGAKVSAAVRTGTPWLEVIREAMRWRAELVLKEARPGRGLASRLFTSLDLHLMRKCPVPVWVTQASDPKRLRTVVAAVDVSSPTPERKQLNAAILDQAIAVARADRAIVHVVHAWELRGEQSVRMLRASVGTSYVSELIDRQRRERAARVEALVAPCREQTVGIGIHLLKGEAGTLIPAFARRHQADLVVMGTVGRSGIPGFIIGNTAETVLSRVQCSVVAIKPPGFVTPVELMADGPGMAAPFAAPPVHA